LPNLTISDRNFQLKLFTLADSTMEMIREQSAAIFELFLKRETEFDVHESVVIDYPDLSEPSTSGFLANAAAYAASRTVLMKDDIAAIRIVILTTFGNVVRASLEAAGYDFIAIDMPAGPEHTAAFILEPSAGDGKGRTLYIEAVNEDDDKIKPSFALVLTDANGRLCGGACGSIHESQGKRYAYLATMALASALPQGTGTAIMEQLMQFLRSQNVAVVHLGTQTAAKFYEKIGFKVDHRLINKLRVRREDGQEVTGDLVMLSMTL
jgi:GNAT superfamily N-acetyltransferase